MTVYSRRQHCRQIDRRTRMLRDSNFGYLSEEGFRPQLLVPTEEAEGEEQTQEAPLLLQLKVTDPEISAALRAHAEGEARNHYALGALRLGVLALRTAAGQIDTGEVRNAGQKLMSVMTSLLGERAPDLPEETASALRPDSEPQPGLLRERRP